MFKTLAIKKNHTRWKLRINFQFGSVIAAFLSWIFYGEIAFKIFQGYILLFDALFDFFNREKIPLRRTNEI